MSLLGLSSFASADITTCQQAYQKDVRQCYDLVMSARAAVSQSNAMAQASVESNPNAGTRALGQTMQGAGQNGLETWQTTKTRCEKLKDDCATKCKIPDAGASAIAKKCEESIEKYASIIDNGIETSSQAVTAGANTATSAYDMASTEKAERAQQNKQKYNDQVVDAKSDLNQEGQESVQQVKDFTLVGRDANGRAIAEESYVLPKQVERVKQIMQQSDGRVCTVDVYTNQYVCE